MQTSSLPLVIYDTGIVLQAALNPDSPAEYALQLADNGVVEAVMSNRLRSEYEDVLRRPSLQAKRPILRRSGYVDAQLARVDAVMQRRTNAPEQIEYPRDPKDAPTLNLALWIQADFIVTRDADLLDLDAAPTFRRLCPKTRILDPVAFLQTIVAQPAR